MTNQEVIYFLNQIRKILLDDNSWLESTIQPINEAFDKSISALKAQEAPAQPEIIMCKECEYSADYYHEGDCYCLNPKWGLMYFGGSWEFYCADAERTIRNKDDKKKQTAVCL